MANSKSDPKYLAACRPARILIGKGELDIEFQAARWAHHKLLEFEDKHQRDIDKVQGLCVPQLRSCIRILARLSKWDRWRERSTRFVPRERPELREYCKKLKPGLVEVRNADPRWKAILVSDREALPDAALKKPRRTAKMTDEQYAERCKKEVRRTPREVYQNEKIYPQIRCFYDTWNELIKSVKQAKAAVLTLRKHGKPADWRHPRWDQPNTITASPKSYKILERNGVWWTIKMRLFNKGWVHFRAKLGNWHNISEDNILGPISLTRRKNGHGWEYSVSLLVAGVQKKSESCNASTGIVSLDWGHREHQHPNEHLGIRAFFWRGEDGAEGEILLPPECRELKDLINSMKSRLDETFNARKASLGLPDKNRFAYLKRIRRTKVLTECQHNWLFWEVRHDRRIKRCNKRITNLREDVYTQAIKNLRKRYKTFVVEDESTKQHQQMDKDVMSRNRKRENRDMTSRYEFLELCERFGADLVKVPSRNSTRECPEPSCTGLLPINGPELLVACPACGIVRDKDRGACVVLLRRGKEVLANREVAA